MPREEEKEKKYFHVCDNSNGFREWLDKKGLKYKGEGFFTSIETTEDLFQLGIDFALFREKHPQYKGVISSFKSSLKEEIEKEIERWATTHPTTYVRDGLKRALYLIENFKPKE